jgi:hypothetical protein
MTYACHDCGPAARFVFANGTVTCTCGKPAVWLATPPVIRQRNRRITRR